MCNVDDHVANGLSGFNGFMCLHNMLKAKCITYGARQ
jgi:hypothetical protein